MASPIPDRVEFASDQWVAAAHTFLTDAVEQHRNKLAGINFVLVEKFTNAPPHLGFTNAETAITYTVCPNGASAKRGESPNADRTMVGDYQAILYGSDLIGATVPGEMARITRELIHMFGPNAIQMTGKEVPQELMPIFLDLHDHLARRTVESPDLTHRASRQGLTSKLAEYQENGYTILESVISDDMADELRNAILTEVMPYDRLQSHGLLHRGRIFELMIQHPLLRTVIESALGRGAILASLAGVHKETGPGAVPMHTDYTFVPAPYPEFSLGGVAVWATEDWDSEDVGPTWVIPGSQHMRRYPTPEDKRKNGAPILMPKGSVVFFGDGVWHWQGDRTAQGGRVTLHAQYTRGFMRPLDSLALEPHILDRNGPAFSELTGKDDPFEKSGVFGHDMQRWQYMQTLLGIHNGDRPAG